MTWWQRVRRRWRLEDQLDTELRYHFDRLVADYTAEGAPEREARRRARAEFGGLEAIKDDCRDARGTRWLHDLTHDVRFAARLLAKERRFTAVAVFALALGIGVNNTQFTVVNALCLRGLPFAEARRLVDIAARDETHNTLPLSRHEFDALRASLPPSLGAVAAYASTPAVLRDEERAAERITVAYVSAAALATIGQQPMLGRDFRADEERVGNATVAIVAAEIWRKRYGADPGLLGRQVRINGKPLSVVGVMPDGFRFPDNADVWQPLGALDVPADARQMKVYARLSENSTLADADAEVAGVLMPQTRAGNTGTVLRPVVVPLNDRYIGDITNPAWIAFMTVGGILVVIACSNVATLLLAKGARRAPEMALRRALGATRARILRQLLVESAMLACAGGVAAAAVSWAGLRLLAAAIPEGGLPYWVTLTMDTRVLAVLAAVCLGTVFVFGLAPAVQLTRASPSAAMKQTTLNASEDRRSTRLTWLFLTAQLALTVMLLSKLGLTLEQFRHSQAREPAVDAAHVLTFGMTLPDETYAEPGRRAVLYRTLRERLTGPGRAAVMSVASAMPTSGRVRSVAARNQPLSASSSLVRTVVVDPYYFNALGLSLQEGRNFAENSVPDGRTSVIVNRRFADLFLPGASPVGQRIRLGSPPGAPTLPEEVRTVIGVVPSLREQPTAEPLPAAFLPLSLDGLTSAIVLLRAEHDPAGLAPAVREEVRRLDPEIPVNALTTLAAANWTARWNSRVSTGIITTITFIALALAATGLAALTAYAVARRRRELGIRLAMGATRSGLVRLVLRRVLVQVLVGVAVGAIGAKAWDPGTPVTDLLGAGLLAVVVIVGASAWPAASAGRIDPLDMLREQ